MSREAPYVVYPNLIFREVFDSEQGVRSRGGQPTDVSFVNGKAVYNGTSSKVNYNLPYLKGGTYSVRIRCNPTNFSAIRMLFDCRGSNNDGTGYIFLNATTGNLQLSTGTAYVNGITSTNITAGINNEIVITGISLQQGTGVNKTLIGSHNGNTYEFLGTIDLFEIYEGTLTPSEVYNLAHNLWNTELNLLGTLLDYNSSEGVIEDRMVGSNVGSAIYNGDIDLITDSWIAFDGSITSETTFQQSAKSAGTYKNILTSGKKYRVHIIGNLSNSNVIRSGTSTVYGIEETLSGDFNLVGEFIADSITFYIAIENSVNTLMTIDYLYVQEIRPDLVPTSVDIVKIGSKYSAKFDGSASKIDTGTTFSGLTGSITTMLIVKLYSWGGGGVGNLINVGDKFILYVSSAKVNLISNGSTTVSSAVNSISLNTMLGIAVTRTSTGVTNFYIIPNINLPLALSGTPDQAGGTPVAGLTNYLIGNNVANSRGINGLIPKARVEEGILTLPQMQQWFTENLKDIR